MVLPCDTKDKLNAEQVYPSKIKMEHLVGPHIGGQDLSKVVWPEAYDRPVSPLELGSGAIQGIGKRDRVLSDPLSCVTPVKVRKIDDGEHAQLDDEVGLDEHADPDAEPDADPDADPDDEEEEQMDVSCFFSDV